MGIVDFGLTRVTWFGVDTIRIFGVSWTFDLSVGDWLYIAFWCCLFGTSFV